MGKHRRDVPWYQAIIAGGMSGAIEICLTYPTEYVKTVQQLYGKNQGVMTVARDTVKSNGVGGLSALLFFAVPKNASRFFAYEIASKALTGGENRELKRWENGVAGAFCGAFEAVTVVTPQETMKVKLVHDQIQESGKRKYKNLFHGVSTIVKEQGIGGTYKGVTATILKQSSNQLIRWLIYQDVRRMVAGKDGDVNDLKWYQTMAAGAIAGATSVLANTPVDVVKTKLQGLDAEKYGGSPMAVCRDIMKNDGVLGFYRGLVPRMMRVTADVAIVMVVYEQFNKLMDQYVWKNTKPQKSLECELEMELE